MLPLSPLPAADWPTVGERVSNARDRAGIDVESIAVELEIEPTELVAFESGNPVLGTYELEQLADRLETTVGAWIYGDQPPLFRGNDAEAAKAAEEVGVSLMTSYLATEALLG